MQITSRALPEGRQAEHKVALQGQRRLHLLERDFKATEDNDKEKSTNFGCVTQRTA
jgi:hypothetical protein